MRVVHAHLPETETPLCHKEAHVMDYSVSSDENGSTAVRALGQAQELQHWPSMKRPGFHSQHHIQQLLRVHAYYFSNREVEIGGLEVQGHLHLHSKSETSLGGRRLSQKQTNH